jgi:hypothetical protein
MNINPLADNHLPRAAQFSGARETLARSREELARLVRKRTAQLAEANLQHFAEVRFFERFGFSAPGSNWPRGV